MAASEENLRIIEDQYKEGLARTTDVLDAESVLAESRWRVVQMHYRAYARQAGLLAAMGEDLPSFYERGSRPPRRRTDHGRPAKVGRAPDTGHLCHRLRPFRLRPLAARAVAHRDRGRLCERAHLLGGLADSRDAPYARRSGEPGRVAGAVRATIDPRDYDAAILKAQASVAESDSDQAVKQAAIAQAKAQISAAQSQLDLARADLTRISALYDRQSIPKQKYDQAVTAEAVAKAQL